MVGLILEIYRNNYYYDISGSIATWIDIFRVRAQQLVVKWGNPIIYVREPFLGHLKATGTRSHNDQSKVL